MCKAPSSNLSNEKKIIISEQSILINERGREWGLTGSCEMTAHPTTLKMIVIFASNQLLYKYSWPCHWPRCTSLPGVAWERQPTAGSSRVDLFSIPTGGLLLVTAPWLCWWRPHLLAAMTRSFHSDHRMLLGLHQLRARWLASGSDSLRLWYFGTIWLLQLGFLFLPPSAWSKPFPTPSSGYPAHKGHWTAEQRCLPKMKQNGEE